MLAQLGSLANMGMSIGGFLYGKDKAGDASARAQAAARQAAREQVEGLGQAINERRAGTDRALGFLSPYESSGRESMTLLADALGVNGPEAQTRYFSTFQNDPGFMQTQKAGTDAIEQSAAGGGMLRSGGTLKSLHDYGSKNMFQQISDRLTRLTGLGQQGQTAATGMAGFTDSGSSAVANYLRDIGTAQAGGTINASNADQQGTQNVLQMLGYTMGSLKQPMNDLLGSFKMPGAGGGSFYGGSAASAPSGYGNFTY